MSETVATSARDVKEPITYLTVAKQRDVQLLAFSRAALRLGTATLAYGVMVYLARQNASQMQIALVGASTYLAAVLFGLQGGLLADSIAKRSAIAFGCLVQALLCLVIPLVLGHSTGDLVLLMFLTSALAQIVTPGISAIIALIASPAEMATTSALISLTGSVASAIGSSFLAPVLLRFANLNVLLAVVGILFLFGASRAIKLPAEDASKHWASALRSIDWKSEWLTPNKITSWIRADKSISSMVLLVAIVGALYEAFTTLMPAYVRDVLHADPVLSVYIFAPAGLGFLGGALGGPWLISKFGERRLAIAALFIMSAGMMLFGVIGQVAPVIAFASPLRLLELFGLSFHERVLAASLIAIPTNFGSSIASASVQVFINRRVPAVSQGKLFGMKEVQENLLNTATILGIGLLSLLVSVQLVMIVSPVIVILLVLRLLRYSYRIHDEQSITRREAWHALIGERDDEAPVQESAERAAS